MKKIIEGNSYSIEWQIADILDEAFASDVNGETVTPAQRSMKIHNACEVISKAINAISHPETFEGYSQANQLDVPYYAAVIIGEKLGRERKLIRRTGHAANILPQDIDHLNRVRGQALDCLSRWERFPALVGGAHSSLLVDRTMRNVAFVTCALNNATVFNNLIFIVDMVQAVIFRTFNKLDTVAEATHSNKAMQGACDGIEEWEKGWNTDLLFSATRNVFLKAILSKRFGATHARYITPTIKNLQLIIPPVGLNNIKMSDDLRKALGLKTAEAELTQPYLTGAVPPFPSEPRILNPKPPSPEPRPAVR